MLRTHHRCLKGCYGDTFLLGGSVESFDSVFRFKEMRFRRGSAVECLKMSWTFQ